MTKAFWGLCVAAALATAVPAVGQTRSVSAQERALAKEHFEKAQARFSAGDYLEAVAHFKVAYDLTGAADILYNIGLSYEQAGDTQQAVAYYRRYLAAAESPEDRQAVEERIAWLGGDTAVAPESAAAPKDEDGYLSTKDGDEAEEPQRRLHAFGLGLRMGPEFSILLPRSELPLDRHHFFAVDVPLDFYLNDWFAVTGILAFAGYMEGRTPIDGREPERQFGGGIGVTADKHLSGIAGLRTRLLFVPTGITRATSSKKATWLAFHVSVGLVFSLPKNLELSVAAVADAGPAFVVDPDPFVDWKPSFLLAVGGRVGLAYRFL